MKRVLLTMAAAAAMLLTADLASAQFVPGECTGTGQKKMQGKQGNGNGQGPGAKSGKRTGPRDGSGPIHDPQGGGPGPPRRTPVERHSRPSRPPLAEGEAALHESTYNKKDGP